jgi:hypothetical protein
LAKGGRVDARRAKPRRFACGSPPDARKNLDDEARKAKGASTRAGTGAATTGSGSAIGGTALDWSHMNIWESLLAGVAIAFFIVVAAALIRQVIIHDQRAEAYAKA